VPLANDPRNLWCLGYGLNTFDKLFTSRQLIALTTFANLVVEARERLYGDAQKSSFPDDEKRLADCGAGAAAYADAVATYLAFAQSKACNRNTSLCVWETKMDRLVATFGRQAIPMVWDFAETNPFAGAGGDIYGTVESVCEVLDKLLVGPVGTVNQADATTETNTTAQPVVSTDPPYYDNIGYADLSDFFYVWLRRTLASIFPKLLTTVLTPKTQELIATPYRHAGDKERSQRFFEDGLGQAFARLQRSQDGDFPLTIYYAFKQSESDEDDEGEESSIANVASTGWETMLEAVSRAGFSVTGTWPIRTEQPKGLRAYNQNSLASSIVLVCRLRPENASLATRKEFITTLRRELPDALRNLQRGNIAPVDLAQAAIGPGMAVFTRYAKVLESGGSPMTVRTALGLINQTLDEVLAEQEGEFDGDTRWALSWFEQFGMDDGPFGDAETLSKAKNTAVNGLVDAGVITARGGNVRLMKREELPTDWNPTTDKRLTVWEVTQHLIHRLDQQGESGAAELVRQLGGIADISRDLAYRLYSTCERKKWSQEALAYNSLVVAWPELTKLARSARLVRPKAAEQQSTIAYDS
jgi:putative DNA methylase